MVALAAVVAGCDRGGDKAGEPPENAESLALPRASVTLRVGVVSDPELQAAIDRLRGEWAEVTDGEIQTVPIEPDGLLAAAEECDLMVFPSRSLGELCEANALRPVRDSVLQSEMLQFDGFLPLIREHEIVYGQQVMALPLGCPTPLLLTADANALRIDLPDDNRRLALVYLAWAAPHAVHRSRTATLFDADTFVPRLSTPAFVRALESLVAAADEQGDSQIVWPDRDEPLPPGVAPEPLPGASEAYNGLADAWEPTDPGDQRATLLASDGRLIGVARASRNAATAFRYAAWLAGPENAGQLSTASDHVANCRGARTRSADAWRATDDRQAARAFAEAGGEALRAGRFLLAPRVPGADAYLEALGEAVREALEGAPPAGALAKAVQAWDTMSAQRGRDAQHAAYMRSVNSRPLGSPAR
ncbi:hypothetical protein [Botrimarina sp.]|uniref:hypothetical protein n=1 Tax=Botrimarina sp. TaxID=2795802 RepID=UPI0032EC4569